jgi:hemolysin-activating ACP:hemolysin acyltransferase
MLPATAKKQSVEIAKIQNRILNASSENQFIIFRNYRNLKNVLLIFPLINPVKNFYISNIREIVNKPKNLSIGEESFFQKFFCPAKNL